MCASQRRMSNPDPLMDILTATDRRCEVGKFCLTTGTAVELTPQKTPQPAICAAKMPVSRHSPLYSGWHGF
jgi:hypothetical protein